jgi:hypothetical protein
VKDSGPGGPRVGGGPLREVVHVHVVARLRVPVSIVDYRAGEGVVTDHLVEGVPVLERVVGVQPIGVLVHDGFSTHLLDVEIELSDSADEVFPAKIFMNFVVGSYLYVCTVCQGLWHSLSKILIPKFCLHVKLVD